MSSGKENKCIGTPEMDVAKDKPDNADNKLQQNRNNTLGPKRPGLTTKKNVNGTAASRLRQDYIRLMKDPVPYITAAPLPTNVLEW